ncbi:MAG: hypothetical protein M3P32_02940 [Chloroflexota bacterium]|nr:hypothetical protein [Chloroflexota bacterium]
MLTGTDPVDFTVNGNCTLLAAELTIIGAAKVTECLSGETTAPGRVEEISMPNVPTLTSC